MHCAVYKGHRKTDTYLFVEKEDVFDRVPIALLDLLGELSLVTTIELTIDKQLAQANTELVIQQLQEQGYYLQMPSTHPETSLA